MQENYLKSLEMEWKCGYCDSKSIHYKVTDIKNLTSSGNVKDLRDIQEIFSKDVSLNCFWAVNLILKLISHRNTLNLLVPSVWKM